MTNDLAVTTESVTIEPDAPASRKFGRILGDYAIVWIVLALFIAIASASPPFLSSGNIVNLLDQWAATGIIAMAGTFVLISRMFDLSVGAIYALAGTSSALIANATGNAFIGLAGGIILGALVGLVNGVAVAVFRINPFIATLATSLIVTGTAIYITNGQSVQVTDPAFADFARTKIFGITMAGFLMVLLLILGGFMLSKTTFGRRVYAVGGNPEAARLSGVSVKGTHIAVFVLSGLMSGLAGVLAASRVSGGQPDVGQNLTLVVIACVIVGGTTIFGGEGAIWRTALGILLYAMIGNGFVLIGLSSNLQQITQGLILLLAVGIDAWTRLRSSS